MTTTRGRTDEPGPAGRSADGSDLSRLSARVEELERALEAATGQVRNLELALTNSRLIGVAVGVIMTQSKRTVDDAFEVLRVASQARNVKLHLVAEEVALTGMLPVLPPPVA